MRKWALLSAGVPLDFKVLEPNFQEWQMFPLFKDTCQGDSGVPLYHDGAQMGIISWGYSCGDTRWPSVFTDVSEYIDLINENIG